MEIKFIEVRDRATFIPALAIKISAMDGYLSSRAGFSVPGNIVLIHLQSMKSACDPYDWGGDTRTMPNAHAYIEEHWDTINNEDVIDVEHILGEKTIPKISERYGETNIVRNFNPDIDRIIE